MHVRLARLAAYLFMFALPLLLTSCSKPKVPVHPVEGKVLFNDQPCAEAEVVFHPLDGQLERGRRPQATTDANGRFVITTNIAGDGAVAKEYAITVELRDKIMRGEDMVRDGPNLLPARYAKPETSKLRYRVVEGINQVPVLKLTDAE